ncbi:DUF1616 domain-containing protein [Candidatus Heimdallarchaeota archaeon]|nr:MAG: DUF1616 domain-containing protein [Candidatus Heimdallarchaeota archaeon]
MLTSKNENANDKHPSDKKITTSEAQKIKEYSKRILETERPATIRELVELIIEKYDLSEEKIICVLREQERSDELTLREPEPTPITLPLTLKAYFFEKNFFALEFWIVLSVILLTTILVFIDVQEGFFFYLRYIIVSFFMLIITGWTFTSALFPELDGKLRLIERAATAIGMSIVIIILDGLFLNYTFGFTVPAIGISLIIITIANLVIAIILRFRKAKINNNIQEQEIIITGVEKYE